MPGKGTMGGGSVPGAGGGAKPRDVKMDWASHSGGGGAVVEGCGGGGAVGWGHELMEGGFWYSCGMACSQGLLGLGLGLGVVGGGG